MKLHTLLFLVILSAAMPVLGQSAFEHGEVFAGLKGGKISRLTPEGQLRRPINDHSGAQHTGMCFDLEGNLYVTKFDRQTMSKHGPDGRIIDRSWGGRFSRNPESCVVDGDGNVYTGEVFGENRIRKFDPSGRLLASYRPKVADKGVDWIELAADQCTMFYTSESNAVMRYDVCRDHQLPDFARGLGHRACFALRLRENGELLVACTSKVYRLSPGGEVIGSFTIPNEVLFAMNLDPDGEHFWTGGLSSGNIYKVHIDSGRGTEGPVFHAEGQRTRDSGSLLGLLHNAIDNVSMGGLAVYGERTAAVVETLRRAEAEETRSAEDTARTRAKEEAARRKAEEGEAQRRAKEEEARRKAEEAEAQRKAAEEQRLREAEEAERRAEEARRKVEEEARRKQEEEKRRRRGKVRFSEPRQVDFGRLTVDATLQATLDLTETTVEEIGRAEITTTLDTRGLALEIETEEGWQPLGSSPRTLELLADGPRRWPLRIRAGGCLDELPEDGKPLLVLDATGGDPPETTRTEIPLSVETEPSSWIECWWPALATAGGGLFLAFLIYGFVSPSRFAPRAGIILSPEEDLGEGFFHPIRAQRGSGSGFYRDARIFVAEDYRLVKKPAGTAACLRAEGQRIQIKPQPGASLERQTADGEWEALPPEESLLRLGVPHRNGLKTLFFELRNG